MKNRQRKQERSIAELVGIKQNDYNLRESIILASNAWCIKETQRRDGSPISPRSVMMRCSPV